MSKAHKDIKFSPERIKNSANAHRGLKRSEKTKKKMSANQKGFKNSNWKNGRYKKKGYVFILKPDHPFANSLGYVREHRLIIESQIGRPLLPKEEAHHLGEKDDNRPHMLMAFVNQATHNRFEKNCPIKPSNIIFDGRHLKSP